MTPTPRSEVRDTPKFFKRFKDGSGSSHIDEHAVKSAYRRWAPVYDHTFGKVAAEGRKHSVEIINQSRGRVLEVGVGTGLSLPTYARHLEIVGIDLSPQMIECARKLHPIIEFRQADMEALPVANGTWAGLVAFYSLIHVPRDRVVATLREFRRVLRPRGLLLLAFHIGAGVVHLDEWWGHRVSVDFVFFCSGEVERYLTAAGFEVERSTERDPYPPEVEHQSRRGYVLARSAATKDAV